jgi:transposase
LGFMFLKKTTAKGKTYLSIAESYWKDGQSKHKIYVSLGSVDKFKKSELASIGKKLLELAGVSNVEKKNVSIEEIERLNWGAQKIYQRLWDLFDLDRAIQQAKSGKKVRFNLEECIFTIVMSRLVAPSSKRQVYLKQNEYIGNREVDLHQIYRSLDFLSETKERLEKHLFEINRTLFNQSVDIVFYDVSTLYFESCTSDTFKEFGYSKDCKFNEVQVVFGLIIDQEGRPVGYDVFPGNTFEGHTLLSMIEKLKNRFSIDKVIIVADRGINSKLNLKSIKDAGYDYIVGSRLRSLPSKVRKEILDLQSYEIQKEEDGIVVFSTKKIDFENMFKKKNKEEKWEVFRLQEKLFCSFSLKRAKKDRHDRERLFEKAKKLLESSDKIENKRGARRYIKKKKQGEFHLDEDKRKDDEKWDGIYGIQCSKLNMSGEEVMDAYKNLWRIEEAFRVLKTNLETRPIFHWTPKRIKGHLVTCFIAFLLERTLELRLRKNKIDYSTNKIKEAISKLEVSHVLVDGEAYYLRSKLTPLGKEVLKALELKEPPTLTPSNSLSEHYL